MSDKKLPAWSKEVTAALAAFAEKNGGKITNENIGDLLLDVAIVKAGKNRHQLVGKANAMKLYEKADKKAVVGGVATVRKAATVSAIEILAGAQDGAFASFEKASKPQLELLQNLMIAQGEAVNLAVEAELERRGIVDGSDDADT